MNREIHVPLREGLEVRSLRATRPLKRVIRPTRGFQTMKTASATIKGFEVMRMIRQGHCLTCKPHVKDEIRFVNKLFDILTVAA